MPTSGRNLPSIKYISRQIIIEINNEMIGRFKGASFREPDNLKNPGSLSYILEAIQFPVGGQNLYPTIFEKAAALGHEIIHAHVFHDGCKRTGSEVMRLFLAFNGYYLPTDAETIKKALDIAESRATPKDLAEWLEARAVPMAWPEESSSGSP